MDILFTLSLIGAIATVSAVGVLALPWTDHEISATQDALEALGEVPAAVGAPKVVWARVR